MAGHSHWAGIKHKKALIDNKRGKAWSKLSKAIIIAAKLGGGDANANSRLRTAISDAKAASMPRDNIERAIKRGTGEIAGGDVEEIIYEGYGPHGVAIMLDIMTDNRNRTAPELRKVFEKYQGNLGATNCVAYMFERKGLIIVPSVGVDEETVMRVALEAGAEDFKLVAENYEIISEVDAFAEVGDALEASGINVASKTITRIPNLTVELDGSQSQQVMRLLESLDDHDDVQNVSANAQFAAEAVAES
jgi:YebC/PmpR family DNA-binding regulatory protein